MQQEETLRITNRLISSTAVLLLKKAGYTIQSDCGSFQYEVCMTRDEERREFDYWIKPGLKFLTIKDR